MKSQENPFLRCLSGIAQHNEKITQLNREWREEKQRQVGRHLDADLTPAVFQDEVSDYTLGTKTLLLTVLCPGDGGDCANDAPPYGYNTGVIASTHNNNVEEYMQFLVNHNHNFYVNQSFGKVGFDATIVTVTLDSYQGADCVRYKPAAGTATSCDLLGS